MKKSELYKTAIAAVIDNDGLEMAEKIEVLRLLCEDLGTAEFTEKREVGA